jgi:hypothetical protein
LGNFEKGFGIIAKKLHGLQRNTNNNEVRLWIDPIWQNDIPRVGKGWWNIA